MEVRALRDDEREECLALWRTVWPGDNDAYFRRYFEGDVEWLPYYTQVAVEAGHIVSAVHICKRTVACGEFRLQMGGIANVATLPDYRGKGLNSACLQAAIGIMEADAIDFSLLFTGINGYYAKQGFSTVSRTRARGAIKADIALDPRGPTVRPARPEDRDALFAVYAEYNPDRPIAVQRSPAYWRDWIGMTPARLDAADPPLVAVDAAGRIVGYIIYQVNFYQGHQITEDYAYVSELGIGKSTEIATALLAAVAARALASGKRELHVSIALDAPVRIALARVCEATGDNVTLSGMARLLSRTGLLRSFLMEWNERWLEAGRPAGAVSFDTPYGAVELNASGRFLEVAEADAIAATLPQSALLGLILGTLPSGQASTEPDRAPLLAALFPPQDGVYWSADGF